MAVINIESIMGSVIAFAGTSRGKRLMKDEIMAKVHSGNESSVLAGDNILTIKGMEEAADDMIAILKQTAQMKKLPESVLEHFDNLTATYPKESKDMADTFVVDIYFDDDISRMSLFSMSGKMARKRTGNGIENIISLFDTGYHAHAQVYGLWDGHMDLGIIPSLTDRDGLHFMQDAVDAFNSKWSKKYGVIAKISADPKFYYREDRTDI